jgi:hypothetical protein
LGSTASAQISVPEDSQFVLQIDLQAIQRTELGKRLIEAGKEAALKELSKHGEKQEENPLEKVTEVLGFDPFQEVKRLVITASDFEHPEKSMTLWLHMGKTTGNLEGLLLGLPNYELESHGTHEIHSAKPDDVRVFGAVHQDQSNNHVVIISPNRDTLEQQLDVLDKKAGMRDGFRTIQFDDESTTLISAQVLKLPLEEMGEGPHTNVAKRLKSLSFAINELDEDLDFRLNLQTETEKQAEQIRQMVQGLFAMVEFAQSMEADDEDLQQVAKFLKDAKSSVDGNTVKLRLRLPIEIIEKAIRDEMD